MEILTVENYSITYDGVKNAVDRVSLRIDEGEIVSIVGESGSGKSTLLHGVLGLLPRSVAEKGTVRVLGRDLAEMKPAELRKLRGEEVAMIFQDTGRYMNPISRIGAQFRQYLRCHGHYSAAECDTEALDLLRRVHLADGERVLRSYPFELSGGMRQRVGIAMAMALKPRLLLADEPTSALDVTVQAQIVRQMMDLRKKYGTTIILVTHNMGVAAYMSDRVGVMRNGALVELGPTERVIHAPEDEYTRNLLGAVIELDDERMAVATV